MSHEWGFPGHEGLHNPIPGRKEPVIWHKERNFTDEEKSVALHEMGHALMAFSMGVSVDYVSVVPNAAKGYKGVTVLSYVPDDEYKLQKIAAGGSIFSPEGNGGDVGVIDSLESKTGKGRSEAFASARAFRDYLSDDEWETVAEIVADRKFIKGNEIQEVIQLARDEVAWKNGKKTADHTPESNFLNLWIQNKVAKSEEKNAGIPELERIRVEIVDEIVDGMVVTYQVRNNELVEDSILVTCEQCGGKDIHTNNCVNKGMELKVNTMDIVHYPIQAVTFTKNRYN